MTGCTKRCRHDSTEYHKTNLGYTKAFCAIKTLLCGDTSFGINAAISTEALKRHSSSSVDLAFKLSDLKPKGCNGGGNDGTGEGQFLFPTLLHTLLLISSSVGQR